MKTTITVFLITLLIITWLKGTSHYYSFGFSWNGILPRVDFGHGKAWASVYRGDLPALKELISKNAEDLNILEPKASNKANKNRSKK